MTLPLAVDAETVHADPEGETPWAMQLVARVERANPPTRSDVCAAAAIAVVRLLSDERAGTLGPWGPRIDRWMAGRIRKHCRRARGAAWRRVQQLPGVTTSHGGAEIRAFVPSALDDVPPDIAKRQLTGSELADPDRATHVFALPGGAVVISLCPEPELTLGKAAAAAGHAAQVAAMRMDADRYERWRLMGFPVSIEHPSPPRWRELLQIAPVVIRDAGLTEVVPGTVTAQARWK